MGELRKDYILDRWVIINPKRGQRPHELKKDIKIKEGPCYFCPGKESLTPPEIGRIVKNGGWQVRWFENKFPALKPEGDFEITTTGKFYTHANAYGFHEIVVETPDHSKQLAQLNVEDIETVLHVYARRIVELEKKDKIKYVNVFKNSGFQAGTSIVHSHSQIIATAYVPTEIRDKIKAMRKYVQCPYCSIIESERTSGRFCFENNDFIAFTPYASRFNYEIWIFPRLHIARFEELNMSSLADLLSKALRKVNEFNLDYVMFVHYGPVGENFHVHIEIAPRKSIWGGFELESGDIINSVAPEDAARFYRGEE